MKVFYLILLGLIATSCVIEDYIISQMDFYLAKRTRNSIHLPYKYQDLIRKDIKEFIKSHKGEEKLLIKELNRIDFQNVNLNPTVDLLNEQYYKIAVDYSKILAKYMTVISKSEQESFFRDENEKNLEIKEQMEDQDFNRYLRRYRFFFGELTQEQVKLVESKIKFMRERSSIRLRRRKGLQSKLQTIFSQELDKSEKEKQIHDVFVKYNDYFKSSDAERMRRQIIKNVEKIISIATPDQIERLENKRSLFIRWLTKFSEQDYS